jgi:hypothetical protein
LENTNMPSTVRHFIAAAGLAAVLLPGLPAHAEGNATNEGGLPQRLEQLKPQLARSPFGRPLVLQSNNSDAAPHGDVFALVDHPINEVTQALSRPEQWCNVLLLQTNVKRCSADGGTLEVAITRKYTDAPDTAQAMRFDWHERAASPQHIDVELHAASGPLGTSNYRMRFEAVPAGQGKSFVHLAYGYEAGFAARFATSTYLSTSGRDKVGFTTTGKDEQGKPVYVGGMQGVAERNTMRYFLAIDAYLDTAGAPVEKRLRVFHDALEKYPAQLHETQLDEYLALKRREVGQKG